MPETDQNALKQRFRPQMDANSRKWGVNRVEHEFVERAGSRSDAETLRRREFSFGGLVSLSEQFRAPSLMLAGAARV